MNTPTEDAIAVIGGGASAVVFLAHLSQLKNQRPREIRIFDRNHAFGRGVAYGTAHDFHLLNIRAENMSAFHNNPKHFAEWAAARGFDLRDFVPRPVYGEYLVEVLTQAIATLREQGHEISLIQANVTASKPDGAGFKLETSKGEFKAGTVILATGNATPTRLKEFENLKPEDGYYDDPWRVDYTKIASVSRVIILGTGLSTIDAALALHHHGFSGEIVALSRRGLLPTVHAAPSTYKLPVDFHRPQTALEWVVFLRDVMRKSESEGGTWQAAMDSFRPYTNDIWKQLPAAEQQKFLRKFLPFWSVHRHRMAPQIGVIIDALLREGRLKIEKSPITGAEKTADGLKISGRTQSWTGQAVINCLGYQYKPAPGMELAASHKIGPPLWGTLIETTAIPEIREQAADIAARISDSH